MRPLSWIGIVVLVLGILSFVVPIPTSHRHELKAGDASIGVTTHQDEKLSPAVGGVMCAVGAVLLVAGSRKGA
jgi:drug/metabolite transporter (DMT)-like permease